MGNACHFFWVGVGPYGWVLMSPSYLVGTEYLHMRYTVGILIPLSMIAYYATLHCI